jgi:hypothetical protein
MININGKKFSPVTNAHGVSGTETVFEFNQRNNIVYGIYKGGEIEEGNFVGSINENILVLRFQCVTKNLDMLSGQSEGVISIDENGLFSIEYNWQWLASSNVFENSRHKELMKL